MSLDKSRDVRDLQVSPHERLININTPSFPPLCYALILPCQSPTRVRVVCIVSQSGLFCHWEKQVTFFDPTKYDEASRTPYTEQVTLPVVAKHLAAEITVDHKTRAPKQMLIQLKPNRISLAGDAENGDNISGAVASRLISAVGADLDRLVHVTTVEAATLIKVSDCFGRGLTEGVLK